MSIYICSRCGARVDNDYHPCAVDPKDHRGIDLICPDCDNGADPDRIRKRMEADPEYKKWLKGE